MAKSEKKRQKQQLRKQRKKKEMAKAAAIKPPPFADLSKRQKILKSSHLPLHECLVSSEWQEEGMAVILVSRLQPDGDLIFATFLVDVFCLGVKSAFCNADMSPRTYQTDLREKVFRDYTSVSCSLDLAKQIVYGAIDYAAQFGFEPDKNFSLSRHVLGERTAGQQESEIQFGKDGKPFYITGPNDDMDRILAQLEAKVGQGNYHYICPAGDPFDPDDYEY